MEEERRGKSRRTREPLKETRENSDLLHNNPLSQARNPWKLRRSDGRGCRIGSMIYLLNGEERERERESVAGGERRQDISE